MELEDYKKKKKELEEKILNAIQAFERGTNTKVVSISTDTIDGINSAYTIDVLIEVEL